MTDARTATSWIIETDGWPLHATLAPTEEDAMRAWLGIYFGAIFVGEPDEWAVRSVFDQVRSRFPQFDIDAAEVRLVRCVNA